MKKLIYDSALTGHHSEYISHLVNYIVANPSDKQYVFVVPNEFKVKFPEIISTSKRSNAITWDFINYDDCLSLQKSKLWKRSFEELKIVKQFAQKHNIKSVFMLYFNIFQLALCFKKVSFEINGILFLQFLRMETNSFKEKIKYYRKLVITYLYTKNKKVKNIYILNDEQTVKQLNSSLSTNIFKMLPDPIPDFDEEVGFNIFEHYNIPLRKKVLLHPGAINPRKGTYEIIEAIDFLDKFSKDNFVVVIVGKANKDISEEIQKRISNLKNKHFQIVFDNQFVSNSRLKSLILQSYAILMPYKNTEASSGILGHAVASNVKVLATDKGLVADLVRRYELGGLVDNVTPMEIANKIGKLKDLSINITLSENYSKEHTVEIFCQKIIN